VIGLGPWSLGDWPSCGGWCPSRPWPRGARGPSARATGDKSFHHINDRPRNAPVRTAVGVAGISFYVILLMEGANDVIADHLQVPLYTITWIARVAVFAVPIGAYFATKRICIGLQRADARIVAHGWESGILRQMPSGEFIEVHTPASEEELAVLDAKVVPDALLAPGEPDENGVAAPGSRGPMGRARSIADRAFLETVEEQAGHGDGHGTDGHGEAASSEHAALGAGAASGGSRRKH
jgi:ubiquinol-cytochrome c reductase cytochrome b subunit